MFHPKELVHWLEVATNRRLSAPLADAAFWSLFQQDGAPLADAPYRLQHAGHEPCDLLIVLTTYARSRLCLEKLRTLPALLAQAQPTLRVQLLVLCDASHDDYSDAKREGVRLFGERLTWLDARARLGKPGYWKTYQTAFLAAKLLKPTHTLFLQDDVQYAASMLRNAYALWSETESDPSRRAIYLFSCEDDEPNGRWIRFARQAMSDSSLRLTQWLDLQGYFVDRAFFELLEYRMVPVHENRWRRRPGLSSGVGAQLTRRLFERCNIYQAMPPLVLHGAHASEMNPKARAVRSLNNLEMSAQLGQPVIC